jgi:putative holliday junction resolvase
MKIIAFDAGTKRIGVAVGDDTMKIASPVGFIDNNPTLVSSIQKLFEEYGPGKVIIGNPLNMDGSKNPKTNFADDLACIIRATAPDKEIVMWDERLTSAEAGELLIKHDVSRKRRKKLTDKIAASMILQSFFDRYVAER